uniref:Uncharacterized protein n=1 Tax=candidate division CPR3 bacterium TaxID=2268181 RepID=A0A7C4M051_UNCC3
MKNISENILEKIKKEGIHPIPKWRFLLKNYGVWALFGLSIILGGVAVSVIIFMLADREWGIYKYLDKSFWQYFLMGLPYFWFFLVSAFLAFAWYDLQKTKSGYKYGFLKIAILNILASIVLGFVFYSLGMGPRMDQIFSDNLPFYNQIHSISGPQVWQNPDKGLLAGEITEVIDNENFIVKDLKGELWQADCSDCVWISGLDPLVGTPVRLVGESLDGGVFKISEVRPFDKFIRNKMMQGAGKPRFEMRNGLPLVPPNAKKPNGMRSNN